MKLRKRCKEVRYLYETPEEQLVDLSLEDPTLLVHSPLVRIFLDMGVSFPNCWIGVRMSTDTLKGFLPSVKCPDRYKIPGDLDIIGGPLSNGMPSEYIIGIEIKRFRYLYSTDNHSWGLKDPDSYGTKQARGYSLFGFDKIMLCHFVVAEPVHHPEYNPHLLNASIVDNGIMAVRKKRIEIEPHDPFGYCIICWSQVPYELHEDSLHKGPLRTGSLGGPDIIKSAPKNPFMTNKNLQDVRKTLLQQVQRKLDKLTSHSVPAICRF
jgi:hypothetical protein